MSPTKNDKLDDKEVAAKAKKTLEGTTATKSDSAKPTEKPEPAKVQKATGNVHEMPHQSFLRSGFVFFFSLLMVLFFCLSVVTFWVNRALLNTDAVVSLVTPLAKDPEVQKAIADKITESVVKEGSPEELAQNVGVTIPPGTSPDQAKQLVAAEVNKQVLRVVSSPQFATFFANTVRKVHSQGLTVVQGNEPTVSIDLHDTVNELSALLKSSQLTFVDVDKLLNESKDKQVVTFKVDELQSIRQIYDIYTMSVWIFPALTLLMVGLAMLIAVQKWQALRNIGLKLAVTSGLFALGLTIVSNAKPGGGDADQAAIIHAALREVSGDLRNYCIGIGLAALVVAIGAGVQHRRVVEKVHHGA